MRVLDGSFQGLAGEAGESCFPEAVDVLGARRQRQNENCDRTHDTAHAEASIMEQYTPSAPSGVLL